MVGWVGGRGCWGALGSAGGRHCVCKAGRGQGGKGPGGRVGGSESTRPSWARHGHSRVRELLAWEQLGGGPLGLTQALPHRPFTAGLTGIGSPTAVSLRPLQGQAYPPCSSVPCGGPLPHPIYPNPHRHRRIRAPWRHTMPPRSMDPRPTPLSPTAAWSSPLWTSSSTGGAGRPSGPGCFGGWALCAGPLLGVGLESVVERRWRVGRGSRRLLPSCACYHRASIRAAVLLGPIYTSGKP